MGTKNFTLTKLINPSKEWGLEGFNYRNGEGTVYLSDRLLPARTQAEHLDHKISAIRAKEGYLESAPFHYSLLKFLDYNREHPKYRKGVEEIISFLRESFEKSLLTASGILYKSQDKDIVTHNEAFENRNEKYAIEENIVGPDEYVRQSNTGNRYQAILGSNDVNEINQVFSNLFGRNIYAWFINENPREDTETAVRLFLGPDGFALFCDGALGYSHPGLAVRKDFEYTRKKC